MTVIAYRAGVMACDSCWSHNGTQVASMSKIKRLSSGALLGQAGDNDARAIVDLLDKVKDPKHLPSRQALMSTRQDFTGLLALPRGGLWLITTCKFDAEWFPTDDDDDIGVWLAATMGGYAAVGSGADVAIGAMDAGASARRACEIACGRDMSCRLPITMVHLNQGYTNARPSNRPRKAKQST